VGRFFELNFPLTPLFILSHRNRSGFFTKVTENWEYRMKTPSIFIWNSLSQDGLRIVAPCVLFILAAHSLPDGYMGFLMLAVLYPIDSGHAYATIFRSHLHQPRHEALKSTKIFVICFATLLLGFFWHPANTELAVLYFTAFHHIRQFQGIHVLYGKREGSQTSLSNWLLLFLTAIPVILFHFRPGEIPSILWGIDLPRHPSSLVFWFGFWIWFVVFAVWLIRDLWRLGLAICRSNLLLSFYFPILLHCYCFFVSSNLITTLGPLLLVHGLTYLLLLGKVKAGKTPFYWILAVAVSGGLLNLTFESRSGIPPGSWNATIAFLAAALLAPQLWHYIMDGLVWKRSNPEYARFLSKPAPLEQ
jgi:hypothetical protein